MTDNTPLRILVVEDSALTAEQVCELIRCVSFPVVISDVATEQEALAAVRASAPDAIILDLNLRQGSGFGVLRELASLDAKPAVAILTNFALPRYRELSALMGSDYFLDKARDFALIPRIINSINDRKRLVSPAQTNNTIEAKAEPT